MKEYVIGTDIGTGSTKAVALDTERKVIAVSQYYYSTNRLKPGYSEQDPETIWEAFINCLKEIISKVNQLPVAVSLSSCMHSLVVMDSKNVAITPLITWEDTRSEKIAEALRICPEGERIYQSTGTPIHSMSPLCKIKWLKENEEDVFKKASKFISIKEFVWFRLFNRYEIDHSIASSTGLFNIEILQWNEESLRFSGINESQLSKPVATTFIRKDINPQIAAALAVPANIAFCIGASDGCLANVGSDATGPGVAALTIGTSGAVRIASDKPIVNYGAMIFNYVLDEKIFISGGPVNNGGNVLKWMFKTFLNNLLPSPADYQNIFKQIATIPAGSQGLLFLPYLFGERAPIWDERASGVFFGVQSFHGNAHFFRAALEGICFALTNILEIIETATSSIDQLNVSGGFVHSNVWMQILADISGKKVCLVQTEDASSVGAALLCMKAKNLIDDYKWPSATADATSAPTTKDYNIYQKYYGVFKHLYQPLQKQMHELREISS